MARPRVFFAYIGFDAVSTAAQEAKNPQKDMPIGILGSLVICTILYIMVSTILTGLVNYKALNVAAPVALGIKVTGIGWGELLVNVGAVFGLGTVMLVMLLGQSRVFFSMSKDGLLPKWASAIHPKFRTPWISTIAVGAIVADHARPSCPSIRLAKLVNIGTLLAFTIVCAGVWVLRVRHPDMHRPFKTPFVPAGSNLGHHLCGVSDDAPSADYVGSDDRLAPVRPDHLFRLFAETQQGSAIAGATGGARGLSPNRSQTTTASFAGGRFALRRGNRVRYAFVLAQNSSNARISSPAICCAVACSITKRCIR